MAGVRPLAVTQGLAVNNGQAATPPMGWNYATCYFFSICGKGQFNESLEQLVKDNASAMAGNSGMKSAGYVYVNLDAAWAASGRDINGNLQASPSEFPDGIKAVADYVHGLGLKFGIYSDAGPYMCGGLPPDPLSESGGYGHEAADASQFAAWGVDYVKYDWCYHPELDFAPDIDHIVVSNGAYAAVYPAASPLNTLNGGALVNFGVVSKLGFNGVNTASCTSPTGTDGSLTFNGIAIPLSGTYEVTVFYTNSNKYRRCDLSNPPADGLPYMKAFVSSDGGSDSVVAVPSSSGSPANVASFSLNLSFNAGSQNTVTIHNPTTDVDNAKSLYQAMDNALANTGRAITFAICDFEPTLAPWTWGPSIGNLWRTNSDIFNGASPSGGLADGPTFWKNVLTNSRAEIGLSSYAGPNQWNDPDLLVAGDGLTDDEARSQMGLWSVLAAPLIASNYLPSMSQTTAAVLTNSEVIAIDQDSAGTQGDRLTPAGQPEVWHRSLANGDVAVVLLNPNDSGAVTISTSAVAVGMPTSPTYCLRDVWVHATSSTTGTISATLSPHQSAMYRVSLPINGNCP